LSQTPEVGCEGSPRRSRAPTGFATQRFHLFLGGFLLAGIEIGEVERSVVFDSLAVPATASLLE
jgi:hypothetical protein